MAHNLHKAECEVRAFDPPNPPPRQAGRRRRAHRADASGRARRRSRHHHAARQPGMEGLFEGAGELLAQLPGRHA